MDRISKFNLVHRFEKRSLLIVINCVAALSIFFFGYDQGVMGGVNTNRNYAETMQFGHWNESTGTVVIDRSLFQGGIVGSLSSIFEPRPNSLRSLSIISLVHLSGHYSVATLETGSVASILLELRQAGPSLAQLYNALHKMLIG